ncbi:MAG: hypothetical protein O7F10_05755 [Deltaproteobacteria bacterium]|nr:hypothetical protein [Deltaproteobacteria bacterium]
MKGFCAVVGAVLLILGGCQQRTPSGPVPDWQEFAPEARGFSILFPGTPSEESTRYPTAFGVVDTAWFELEPEGERLAYGVRYDSYPPGVLALGNVSQLILARSKTLESEIQGKTIDEEDVFLDDHSGKQLTVELPDEKLGIYRIFLIDGHMYQLSVKAAPEDASAREISTFLDSFKLL